MAKKRAATAEGKKPAKKGKTEAGEAAPAAKKHVSSRTNRDTNRSTRYHRLFPFLLLFSSSPHCPCALSSWFGLIMPPTSRLPAASWRYCRTLAFVLSSGLVHAALLLACSSTFVKLHVQQYDQEGRGESKNEQTGEATFRYLSFTSSTFSANQCPSKLLHNVFPSMMLVL